MTSNWATLGFRRLPQFPNGLKDPLELSIVFLLEGILSRGQIFMLRYDFPEFFEGEVKVEKK